MANEARRKRAVRRKERAREAEAQRAMEALRAHRIEKLNELCCLWLPGWDLRMLRQLREKLENGVEVPDDELIALDLYYGAIDRVH